MVCPPPIRTPLTDMTGPIGHQVMGQCVPFNLRWLDCLQAHGAFQGKKKCKFLYQDFAECVGQYKQLQRVTHIKIERDRQWLMGQLGKGPKIDLWSKNVPTYDAFLPDYDLVDP
ncbi:NADH dehydrogenase [ubiquinone] iron-sulfur protein 5 [Folsomia candida]|uniref:NADH dehydrogenase [ubiquinone] iron-sulfur protein 5 n=1 Tax=Folsomia candida TaxID=158441 RepID=UPI000B905A6D|nr:NADH dehydrogenase [ubiquinone] iron-sulfur protein 5 [Folsomia candida]